MAHLLRFAAVRRPATVISGRSGAGTQVALYGSNAPGNPSRPFNHLTKETIMQWTKPEYTDLRFGFEITMYILNR
jgi:coenzyme PQQ precursor peptide PqqA